MAYVSIVDRIDAIDQNDVMAARLTKRLADQTRDSIKTSMLINRLMDHINGEVDLSTTQVRGIEVLLKKTLPDLKAVEHSGDPDRPIRFEPFEFVDAGSKKA